MQRKYLLLIGVMALLIGGFIYSLNQPSLECRSSRVVTNEQWGRANTAESLSTEIYLRNIYGDFQNQDSELKYQKSLYELRKIVHLYKISASKRTLKNQECFSDTEITNAQRELKVQKSFEDYFAK